MMKAGDKIRICEKGEKDEIKICNSYFDVLMYYLSNNKKQLNLIRPIKKECS